MTKWLVMITVSWQSMPGDIDQTWKVWLQPFPENATELDVFNWALAEIKKEVPATTNLGLIFYRAVPNIPAHRA